MDGEEDDLDLDISKEILDQEAPKEKTLLGSMIASLHGVKMYLMLKVVGQVDGHDVMVLIDPRASHNFIDEGFVEKKGLKTKWFKRFRVSNTNGKLILVDQIMERFRVILQSYIMREDFYIYPLKRHPHIIFGVQWIFELGNINTKYKNFTMSFDVDGKTHTLYVIQDDFP